ncbi:phage portal protein [Bacillus spizizenii]|uniref:phage portal protein n=1 Tax=Bacillus sp. SPARC3 TaxID=2841275 RepID=UPI001C936544|nr:phage portal protein [Bacillus sp. SPARC3]MBY4605590.1 phage portal protein [Bacillus sp. SPARC3]MEC0585252.1 phage portal protein [Bacillus spizizenii]
MFLEGLFSKRSNEPETWNLANPPDWIFDMFGGSKTASGERVSESTALIHPDVFSCVNVLSDDIAKLSIHTFKKQQGDIISSMGHAVAQLLYLKPNQYMTAFTWKKLMMIHVCLWGNAYSYIKTNREGFITALLPLNPANTHPYVDPNTGMLWYETVIDSKAVELYADEVLHFKGMTEDGIIGKSPIGVIREHIGAQSAATKFNAKLYKNDATPRGILKVPTLIDEDAKQRARDEWEKVNAGRNIAIIDAGLSYESISMPLQEAQFVESMKFNKAQIASIYKVPLHKINELDRATFNNIEHQSIEYVKNTLQPWLVSFEQEIITKLFTDEEINKGYYIKFNVNSELRGDAKSRAEYYEIMERISALNINEIRALEEKNAIEHGDRHLVSLNYTFLDTLEQYQMSKAKTVKGGENKSEQGSTSSDNEN